MERRQRNRAKVILGGIVEHGSSGLTVNCVVRDLSDRGARIRIPTGTLMPNHVDLVIDCKQRRQPASVVWRGARDIGLTFDEPTAPAAVQDAAAGSAWTDKLNSVEANRGLLHAQLGDMQTKNRS